MSVYDTTDSLIKSNRFIRLLFLDSCINNVLWTDTVRIYITSSGFQICVFCGESYPEKWKNLTGYSLMEGWISRIQNKDLQICPRFLCDIQICLKKTLVPNDKIDIRISQKSSRRVGCVLWWKYYGKKIFARKGH